MPSRSDSAREFQKRRADTFKTALPWVVLAFIGFVGGAIIGNLNEDSSSARWSAGILFFAMVFVAIWRVVFIFRARYRCPVCGAVPMQGDVLLGPMSFGYDEGVALNPSRCSKCGAELS